MKTMLVLQFAMLLVMLLAGPTEEFFFEYPRKALMEFFQSLKTKQQPPTTNNVQHYHVHYYPLPLSLLGWTKAPDKQDLDNLYENTLLSFGWTDYRYKFLPEPSVRMSPSVMMSPSIMMSPSLQQLMADRNPRTEGIDISDSNDVRATIDRNAKGILVQVPVTQQFLLHLRKGRQKETTV